MDLIKHFVPVGKNSCEGCGKQSLDIMNECWTLHKKYMNCDQYAWPAPTHNATQPSGNGNSDPWNAEIQPTGRTVEELQHILTTASNEEDDGYERYDYESPRTGYGWGPKCECGAKATGAKDYTPQHSTWCPVYRAE